MKEKVFLVGLFLWIAALSSCGGSQTSSEIPIKILTSQGVEVVFQVNATSEIDWVRMDLDKPGTQNLPEENPDWDLAFQRVEIVTSQGNLSGEEPWYDYDMLSHKVSPKDHSWEILSTEGKNFSLRILNYYNTEGTSGIYTLEARLR